MSGMKASGGRIACSVTDLHPPVSTGRVLNSDSMVQQIHNGEDNFYVGRDPLTLSIVIRSPVPMIMTHGPCVGCQMSNYDRSLFIAMSQLPVPQ